MIKIWCKLIKNGKMTGHWTANADEAAGAAAMLENGLKECCYHLDLPNPMILKKNIIDIEEYRMTKFLPEAFLEAVSFDRMEVQLFEENSKGKKV